MIDKMILEVMNPAYSSINVIEAMSNAKWAVLIYIDQAFITKNWKLDQNIFRETIQSLKRSQSNGQPGVFPWMTVIAPNGENFNFRILFNKQSSLVDDKIKFEIRLDKKKKTVFVSSIRLSSVDKFSQNFVEKFINTCLKKENEFDPKSLGFNYSETYKNGWMRFSKLFDGIEIDVEKYGTNLQITIRMDDTFKDSIKTYKYMDYDNSIEENNDGLIYFQIMDEITSIANDSASSKNYKKIDKLEDSIRYSGSYIEKLFYYPQQKQDFIKLINIMFSEKIFNRYFLSLLSNPKSFATYFSKDNQRVRITFEGSSSESKAVDINELRSNVLKKLTNEVKKYSSKFKSKYECGDFRSRRVLVKCMFLMDEINGSEDFKKLQFLIKQL